jgi:DNA-binding LacI/PurR family transcriptional regulator
LKDIAVQAGVSVMTVSKSLRGASDISAMQVSASVMQVSVLTF